MNPIGGSCRAERFVASMMIGEVRCGAGWSVRSTKVGSDVGCAELCLLEMVVFGFI
jgi:hypothetical protein